ncbi:STAS domain-containing protein [Actinoplanes sp. RD1]|uniref:STAS domain-containing protein n=1 Tax=Actinoplanes sp. RD1 TaxID=3064538 RepID=UPI00274173D9|nr:STAS domain-containing protein [Actinoplanes sp. RD1]
MDFPDRQPLTIEVSPPGPGRRARLAVTGELDHDTVGALRETVGELLDRRPAFVELDLGQVTFIDAAGTRGLLQCHAAATGHGTTLSLRNLHPLVLDVLRLVGADAVLGLPGRGGLSDAGLYRLQHA